MIKEFKAAGTILFGKAMTAQLLLEMKLSGVKKPVIIGEIGYNRKARKIGRLLSSGLYSFIDMLESDDVADEYDFLILAGGGRLVKQFKQDPRPKAHFPLNRLHLKEVFEPQCDFLVIDHSFIKRKSVSPEFFQFYARSMTGGLIVPGNKPAIPASFTFHNRTSVFLGDNGLEKLPDLLHLRGIKKPMVLTDRGIMAVGLLDYVISHLEGRPYTLFADIPPDSRIEVVNRISALFNDEECDGLIALGGGSVLDTGKGVWLNVSLGVADLNSMVGSGHLPVLNYPFIAVPTTSGTGSEVTKVAVVSDPDKGRKLLFNSDNLQPDFAILDSRLTASLPPFLSSITGMDALSHAVEAYTCLGKNPLSDQLALSAVSLIRDNLKKAVEEPEKLEHRRALALASNMAGLAFSNSMVGLVHSIGHSVGSVCHAPHGSCMAVLLAPVLRYNQEKIEPILANLLEPLTGKERAEAIPPGKKASVAIEEIEKLNLRLKELTGERHPVKLSDIKSRNGESLVSEKDFELIAQTALGDGSIIYNPLEARKEDILHILRNAY